MGDPASQVSSFPLPPAHYFKFYSNDNIAKGIAPKPPNVGLIESYSMFGWVICRKFYDFRQHGSDQPVQCQSFIILSYIDIQHPKKNSNTFANDDIIIRPLESQQIRRLYPQHFDRKKELKKLNHSLLVNFLDLVDILINAPESPRRTEKIDDLTVLFLHIHHLLNEYRPHQARETLRVMLELQKRQRLETARR